MKTCPRCGVENKPEKASCWNCWAPLEGPEGGAVQAAPSGRRLSVAIPWTAVAVVALVLIAAGGAYFFLLASRPAQVAGSYLDAVRNGNQEKRDRLATGDSAGQPLLPTLLLVSSYEVDGAGVTMAGGQAEVPAVIHLTVDPLVIGLERAGLSDMAMKYLNLHPVRISMVVLRQGINWRVDQAQTRRRIILAAVEGLPPVVKDQLTAAGLSIPGAGPAPGGLPPARPGPTPPPGSPPAPGSGT
jgi:hypothetical protein